MSSSQEPDSANAFHPLIWPEGGSDRSAMRRLGAIEGGWAWPSYAH